MCSIKHEQNNVVRSQLVLNTESSKYYSHSYLRSGTVKMAERIAERLLNRIQPRRNATNYDVGCLDYRFE